MGAVDSAEGDCGVGGQEGCQGGGEKLVFCSGDDPVGGGMEDKPATEKH